MPTPEETLQASIAAIEAQRATLGDAVADLVIATLRAAPAAGADAPAPPEQALRLVTIVFLDVVGSTRFGQHLDVEALHAVLDGLLARCTAIVRDHGGRVMQYAGDSVLAAFGADEAREDDPERALLTGLAWLDEGRRVGEQVRREHGHEGFDVRVGAHTGIVLIGGGVDDKSAIRGDAVNLAARMEQSAPPGGLRISQTTYHAVRGLFDVHAEPPLTVKGRDEPLATWLVERARPRGFRVRARGVEGVETRMVGRETELAHLLGAFETVAREKRLVAVSVVAEAGLGKSRLIDEFQNTLDAHPQAFWLLLGRAGPSTQLQPYALLRDVLAWRLQIADSDSGDVAREKLVSGLAPWFDAQPMPPGHAGEHAGIGHIGSTPSADTADTASAPADGVTQAHLIGQLIGMDFSSSPRLRGVLSDARQLRDRAFAAAALYLRRLAERDGTPLVMVLDDLHWADDGSLDFMEHLASQAPELPLLLVALARPELLERRPDWLAGGAARASATRLTLRPLAPEQREHLADALLRRLPDAPAALRELITGHADGNPFYMEELVQMLIDDGVIVTGGQPGDAMPGDTWRVAADRFVAARVPPTLAGVLQARLDALNAADKLALQQASIVGPVFWDGALRFVDPRAPASLDLLQRKALARRSDTDTFEGSREYGFQHHLLHQVTYETVLKAQRRAGHAKAAQWLAERVGDRSGEYLAVTAEHFDRAGDQERALDYYERAAVEANARHAVSAAHAYLERALAMPALTDPRRRLTLLSLLSAVADIVGDRALQAATLDERERILKGLEDDTERAKARVARALLADRVGDYDRAVALAHEAVALAEAARHPGSAALAHGELAWVHQIRNQLDEARDHAERGLRWAIQHTDSTYHTQLLVVLATIDTRAFEFESAKARLAEARALARASSNRRVEASILNTLGALAVDEGDAPLARHWYGLARAASREVGSRYTETASIWRLANALALEGDAAGALALAREAADAYVFLSNPLEEARCIVLQGAQHQTLGDRAAAGAAFERALAMFVELDEPNGQLDLLGRIARDRFEHGDAAGARSAVEQALVLLEKGARSDELSAELCLAVTCHRVLAAVGDPRGRPLLEAAHAKLIAMVERFTDPTVRARVLERVENNREAVQEWEALPANATPDTQTP